MQKEAVVENIVERIVNIDMQTYPAYNTRDDNFERFREKWFPDFGNHDKPRYQIQNNAKGILTEIEIVDKGGGSAT